jgi:hypothetical protein
MPEEGFEPIICLVFREAHILTHTYMFKTETEFIIAYLVQRLSLLSWRLLLDVTDSGCGLSRCTIQTPPVIFQT